MANVTANMCPTKVSAHGSGNLDCYFHFYFIFLSSDVFSHATRVLLILPVLFINLLILIIKAKEDTNYFIFFEETGVLFLHPLVSYWSWGVRPEVHRQRLNLMTFKIWNSFSLGQKKIRTRISEKEQLLQMWGSQFIIQEPWIVWVSLHVCAMPLVRIP